MTISLLLLFCFLIPLKGITHAYVLFFSIKSHVFYQHKTSLSYLITISKNIIFKNIFNFFRTNKSSKYQNFMDEKKKKKNRIEGRRSRLMKMRTKNRISHKIILGEYYQKLLIRENNKIIQNYETLFLHK